ncbi:MAG: polymer-forming cytoskeletal protein [Coriobacteriales bacterium]|nr:polymer-forming cytoskeletal protein [Coriobacteriales bacterium]
MRTATRQPTQGSGTPGQGGTSREGRSDDMGMRATEDTRRGRARIPETRGSTLTWVMIVAIVLTLVIASIGAIISFNFHATTLNRTQTQAYYTAQSVNARIVNWLSGVPAPDSLDPLDAPDNYAAVQEPYEFIQNLKTAYLADGSAEYPEVQDYSEADLGGNMGTATTTVEFTSKVCNELKITTTATYADTQETLSTSLYLQQLSHFNAIKTDFDYSEAGIAAALEDVANLPDLAKEATWMPEFRYGAAGDNKPWSYFEVRPPVSVTPVNYKFDLLSVAAGDYNGSTKTVRRNYSYKYLSALYDFKDLAYVGLDPTRGTFLITQNSTAMVDNGIAPITSEMIGTDTNKRIDGGFPYNVEGHKGVLLTETGYFAGKLVYYTLDHPYDEHFTESDWPDITLAAYYSGDAEPVPQRLLYNNGLSLYLTDTSQKKFEMNTGYTIGSGTLYTKRNTNIGTIFDDTTFANNASTLIPFSKKEDLIFTSYDFIFADPGEGQTRRHSRIAGPGHWTNDSTAASRVRLQSGSILVQNNHELAIAWGAVLNAQENKGIVVETGGSLIIEAGADITGNIYVNRGATLTIAGNCTIKGNIYCAGTLNLNSNFTLNALDDNPDNIELGMTTDSPYGNAAGIFIYNDTSIGVGSLNVPDKGVGITISHTTGFETGKVHSFVPYPDYNAALFGDPSTYNAKSHLCTQFEVNQYVWAERPGSTTEE